MDDRMDAAPRLDDCFVMASWRDELCSYLGNGPLAHGRFVWVAASADVVNLSDTYKVEKQRITLGAVTSGSRRCRERWNVPQCMGATAVKGARRVRLNPGDDGR